MRLILASASPRRAELLHAAGYEFEIAAVAVDESHEPGETPARYVRRLAAAKSAAAAQIVGTAKAAPHVHTQRDAASTAPHVHTQRDAASTAPHVHTQRDAAS